MIKVISYHYQAPDLRADNDMDFYGYTDAEWEIHARKGGRAKWLEAKITDDESDRILTAITEWASDGY